MILRTAPADSRRWKYRICCKLSLHTCFGDRTKGGDDCKTTWGILQGGVCGLWVATPQSYLAIPTLPYINLL